MCDWRDTQLAEVVDIKHGFAFKGEFFADDPSDHVLVTPGNFAIGGGFQLNKPKFYVGPVPEDYVLSAGDLIVTMTDLSKEADTLGYSAIVPISKKRFLHNQRIGSVTSISDEVFLPFIAWVMRTRPYRNEIVGGATGSTVKHTSPARILSHRFKLPPFGEQRAIASVLGALDDKIELNRRMNETLEAMARAIFKDWFVDFGPTRAKMEGRAPYLAPDIWSLFPDRLGVDGKPEGWKHHPIYCIADVIYGAPFASAHFNTVGIGEPLIRIRDLVDESPGVWTSETHPKGYKVCKGDIVVGMDGEFRAYLWGGAEAWLNQRVCVFAPKHGFSAAFVRNSIISPLAHIEETETATTVIHLGKGDIDRFTSIVPCDKLTEAFNGIVQPLYDRIVANKVESRTLAATRDLLLPKLMSGEMRVRDAEKTVEAAQ